MAASHSFTIQPYVGLGSKLLLMIMPVIDAFMTTYMVIFIYLTTLDYYYYTRLPPPLLLLLLKYANFVFEFYFLRALRLLFCINLFLFVCRSSLPPPTSSLFCSNKALAKYFSFFCFVFFLNYPYVVVFVVVFLFLSTLFFCSCSLFCCRVQNFLDLI